MPVACACSSVDTMIMWLPVCLCVLCAWISWIPNVGGTANSYHIVYWNASNPMFGSSKDYVVEVNLDDTVDIVCPHYTSPATADRQYEYYVVYMVNETDYERCIINDTSQKKRIINCSNPVSEKAKKYTMLVVNFQPVQGNPDFKEGESYYFISTSGGGANEINNQYKGACLTDSMKMILSVIPRDHSKPGTTREPSTKPDGGVPTPRPTTTTSTTTSTTSRPAPTTKRPTSTTPRRPTHKPGGGDGFPNDDNVIHVGGGGDKNEGTITDSAALALRPPSLLLLLLLPFLVLLHLGLSASVVVGVLR